MPFGVFVELDHDIQGLAHLMELSHEAVKNPEEVLKTGDVRKFKIISIEPGDHRLGLSLKALEEPPKRKLKEEPVASEVVAEESTTEVSAAVDTALVDSAVVSAIEPQVEEKAE